ncbi:MAG: hypothetical protein IJ087_21490 [Eggerthellaceae bacterium]|nr:hypothetical protein [Eggerthellaceae bacterium]
MATAQINARIDARLKSDGDRSFAAVGCTPTRAVRALWTFASKNGHDSKKVRALVEQLEGVQVEPHAKTDAEQRMERAKEGPLIVERALQEMGITNAEPSGFSLDELREKAYLEKWAARKLS